MIGLGKMGMGIAKFIDPSLSKRYDINLDSGKHLIELGGTFYSDIESLLSDRSNVKLFG